MLGTLKLPLMNGRFFEVTGGSFYDFDHRSHVGVKMAREVDKFCDIDIPTHDFCTPPEKEMRDGLRRAIGAVVDGKPLYVGCMAGRGRTGLFLAVLAKAWGIKNPVEYVREHYYPHAVETRSQYDYVMNFPVDADLKRWIAFAKIKSLFRFKKNLTNQKN